MLIKPKTEIPAPVERYFNHVLRYEKRFLRSTRITQVGELRFSKEKKWIPFTATQHISTFPRQFTWDAKVRMVPFFNLTVCDSYYSGRASTQLKFIFPFYNEPSNSKLDESALQRYLGECIWLPTALFPGNGMEWQSIDDQTALAVLKDWGTEVSLRFHFNKINEITGISTAGRYRKVKGKLELTPWRVHTKSYQNKNGVLIPTYVEVEWELPKGNFLWLRSKVLSAEYEYEPRTPYIIFTNDQMLAD